MTTSMVGAFARKIVTSGSLPAAVIELRAPLAGHGPDDGGGTLAAPSDVYRLLIGLVLSRDLLWLVPAPGAA